jgi:hypothetical protein
MGIRYFQIKNQKGTKKKSLIFRERPKKYSKTIKETYIKKTKSLIIEGMHASGKSKELQKIINSKEEIFKQNTFISIRGTDPFSDWYNTNINKQDINNVIQDENLSEDEKIEIETDIRKQHIKIHTLIKKTERAVLFVDDINMLQGKKIEIVKDLIKACSIVICTTKEEADINKTITALLHRKGYETIQLNSGTSYDATNVLFVTFVLAMFATGNHAMAMLIMAGRYALKGKETKK